MKQDRFFEQLKKQMQDQQKQPSANAWHRMEQLLDASTKSTKSNHWLTIAASFIVFGLLSVGYFLLKPNEMEVLLPNTPNQPVVEISSEYEFKQIIEISDENTEEKKEIIQENSISNATKTSVFPKQKSLVALPPKETILVNQNNTQSSENILVNNTITENPITENPTKPNKASQVKIDPNDLLQQVEKELNHEHRESKMDKIQRNLKSLQEQLANRNQEN
ncbi:MAG: hypothetical protein ACK4K1_00185 [Flavobacterium sp.]